jgi:hypothetical protein
VSIDSVKPTGPPSGGGGNLAVAVCAFGDDGLDSLFDSDSFPSTFLESQERDAHSDFGFDALFSLDQLVGHHQANSTTFSATA